jgi:hypothetical protein
MMMKVLRFQKKSSSSEVFICLRKCWKFKPTQKGAAGYCWLFNEND